jgi:hypothetical protein
MVGSVRASGILAFAIQGSSRYDDLGCLPDQTHIRSSHEATAPGFRLRRAGSRRRDHSSLRRLKPCNPSVRPPGSSEADRASAEGLWFCVRAAALAAEPGCGSAGRLHHGPLDDDALGDVLPQGHKKLARQRHDRALAALRASLLEPARQGRPRLVTYPQPGDLDHCGPQPRIAGLRHALLVPDAAALPGRCRKAGIGGDGGGWRNPDRTPQTRARRRSWRRFPSRRAASRPGPARPSRSRAFSPTPAELPARPQPT